MDISCGDIVNRHNHETLKSKTVKLVVDFCLEKKINKKNRTKLEQTEVGWYPFIFTVFFLNGC